MHWSHSVTLSFSSHSSQTHSSSCSHISEAVITPPDTMSRAQLLSVPLLSSHHFSAEGFKNLAEHTSTSDTFPRYIFSLICSFSWKGSRCSPSFIIFFSFSFLLIASLLSLLPINRDSQGWRVAPAFSQYCLHQASVMEGRCWDTGHTGKPHVTATRNL